MNKRIFSLLTLLFLLATLLLCSCQKTEPIVVKDSETCIVIRATEDFLNKNGEMTLIEYMEALKNDGLLEYTEANKMITSINGIENPANFSHCWMLYTSDSDSSNSAWGIIEYAGVEYGSAVVGASDLKIKPSCLYIWVFQEF